jgi:hypothetical protein
MLNPKFVRRIYPVMMTAAALLPYTAKAGESWPTPWKSEGDDREEEFYQAPPTLQVAGTAVTWFRGVSGNDEAALPDDELNSLFSRWKF